MNTINLDLGTEAVNDNYEPSLLDEVLQRSIDFACEIMDVDMKRTESIMAFVSDIMDKYNLKNWELRYQVEEFYRALYGNDVSSGETKIIPFNDLVNLELSRAIRSATFDNLRTADQRFMHAVHLNSQGDDDNYLAQGLIPGVCQLIMRAAHEKGYHIKTIVPKETPILNLDAVINSGLELAERIGRRYSEAGRVFLEHAHHLYEAGGLDNDNLTERMKRVEQDLGVIQPYSS